MIVVISIDPTRLQTMRRIFPALRHFEGVNGCGSDNYRTVCIPKTYHRLGQTALAERWDRETVVFQDDIVLSLGAGLERHNARFDVPLLIYGQTESDRRVAPKAFSANRNIWRKLAEVWDGTGPIVGAWQPIVQEYGLVLDLVKEIAPAYGRNAPCRGCGH